MIIATGAEYRRPSLENLSQFEGAGVYYGATFVEAQLCGGEEVIVVGGGNSAGQAAVFLAQTARRVHMLVRAGGLADSMSRYLIRRIEDNPAIVVAHAHGNRRARRQRSPRTRALAGQSDRNVETRDISHVFLMTGAVPNTQAGSRGVWRSTPRGSSRPGPTCRRTTWPPRIGRWPGLRISSKRACPGVFAVGDVRSGNIKRVASAVGEGSIAIAFVHQVLPT